MKTINLRDTKILNGSTHINTLHYFMIVPKKLQLIELETGENNSPLYFSWTREALSVTAKHDVCRLSCLELVCGAVLCCAVLLLQSKCPQLIWEECVGGHAEKQPRGFSHGSVHTWDIQDSGPAWYQPGLDVR